MDHVRSSFTHENLQKRGAVLSSKCFLCGSQTESICHLFLHCHVTAQLWHFFMNMKCKTDDLLRGWYRKGDRKRKFSLVENTIPAYIRHYGGLYGMREIENALKIVSTPFTR